MNSKGADPTAAAVSTLGKRKFGESISPSASVYEVFLSFYGIDTCLVGASNQTFRDKDELKVGEEIGPELLKAIKESKISIAIFSKNYATSKWCLLELEHIVQYHKNGEVKIYPIVYDADVDVDPSSDVRNQRGSYEVAFSLHEKKFVKGTAQRWRDALKVMGGLKGLELKMETDGREGELVKQVVDKVLMDLKKNYTHVPENLDGIDNPIKALMGLQVDSDYVRIVGIHGMGGLGKNRIAKFIYNQLYKNFDGQCFLDNFDQDWVFDLQKQFISSIQKTGVFSVHHVRSLIKHIFSRKEFLLVLDDVNLLLSSIILVWWTKSDHHYNNSFVVYRN